MIDRPEPGASSPLFVILLLPSRGAFVVLWVYGSDLIARLLLSLSKKWSLVATKPFNYRASSHQMSRWSGKLLPGGITVRATKGRQSAMDSRFVSRFGLVNLLLRKHLRQTKPPCRSATRLRYLRPPEHAGQMTVFAMYCCAASMSPPLCLMANISLPSAAAVPCSAGLA